MFYPRVSETEKEIWDVILKEYSDVFCFFSICFRHMSGITTDNHLDMFPCSEKGIEILSFCILLLFFKP